MAETKGGPTPGGVGRARSRSPQHQQQQHLVGAVGRQTTVDANSEGVVRTSGVIQSELNTRCVKNFLIIFKIYFWFENWF